MGFVSDPWSYDVVLLGGRLVPGEVHLDVMRELATQAQRGSGDDGAEPRFRGLKPCEFTIRAMLHSDEDEAAWAQLAPKIFDLNQPRNRNQLSVVHPQLQRLGIDRCVVIGIGEKKPQMGGPIEATIKCHSVKRRDSATHKPKPKNDFLPGMRFLSSFGPVNLGITGPPSDGGTDAQALKERQFTAVQRARLDNGIPTSKVIGNVTEQFPDVYQMLGRR